MLGCCILATRSRLRLLLLLKAIPDHTSIDTYNKIVTGQCLYMVYKKKYFGGM